MDIEMRNPDDPYTLENLDYWVAQPPDDVILAIVNTVGRQIVNIEGWIKEIQSSSDIQMTQVNSEGNKSLQEICEIILRSTSLSHKALTLASAYVKETGHRDK